ncbi:MAG: ribosome biogenesis GTPase YlqF [Spirochaetaceae bacterium 4572_59]|nr:MAG: ribosome biogenesis GTPase YlqF [Spirochaetaceae bacterium 4572_59]
MAIQWFPGHMTKTKKLIKENLKKMDMVIEIVDARAPLASRNPLLDQLTAGKPRLVLLNKSDLADPGVTEQWLRFFENGNEIHALAVNSKSNKSLKAVPSECRKLCKGKKWINRRPVKAMIVGIPNVGKSTVINTLAGRIKAKAANQPGVTKDMQRVPISRELQIFDTPGLLWHKFDDQIVGMKLASLGSIRDSILHLDDIAFSCVTYLSGEYLDRMVKRYKLNLEDPEEVPAPHVIIEEIGKNRGFLQAGGSIDYERAAILLLKELRDGILGRITLEKPDDPLRYWPVIAPLETKIPEG